jgi:hypothetical protein
MQEWDFTAEVSEKRVNYTEKGVKFGLGSAAGT